MRHDGRNTGRGGRGPIPPPRPRRILALLPLAVLALAGCRNFGKPDTKYDLLEAELRTRERELTDARAELNQLRLLNGTYQRQQAAAGPGAVGDPSFRPGPAGVPTLPLRDITLANGTGGVDDDGRPGDESLMAVILPRDDDGTAVKVPARLTVVAYEVARDGLKAPIGKWEVAPEQLRKTWRGGVLGSGYFVPLQWDRPPRTDRLLVAVRLTTLDNRPFEADKLVTIRPLPNAGPPPTCDPVTTPLPAPTPPDVSELPPPTPAARLLPPKPV